jgi:NitT/TauT family transport system permease protein
MSEFNDQGGGFSPRRGRPSRALPKAEGVPLWKLWTGRLGLGVVFFGLWEYASGRFVNSFWVSKPSLIAIRIWTLALNGKLWYHLEGTLEEVMVGLVVGMAGGIILGIALSYSGVFQHWLSPYILALFSLPKASLAPLFIIWFGIGLLSKVLMVVTMTLFVVFYNIYEGMRTIDPNLIDMMKTYRAKPLKWLKWIVLPSLVNWIINCLRISIGNATVGAIISEMIGSSRGIGYYITYSSGILDTTGSFAGLVMVMAIALGLGALVGALEKLARK